MASINDWAAKAAERIADEPDGHRNGVQWKERVAAIIATHAEPLVALLRERRTHTHCDDSWYCCRCCDQHGDRGTDPADCTCGATEWNARVDAALAGAEPGGQRPEKANKEGA